MSHSQCHISIFHSSAEGHLGCFYFLASMRKAVVNVAKQVSVEKGVQFFGSTLRSGVAGYMEA